MVSRSSKSTTLYLLVTPTFPRVSSSSRISSMARFPAKLLHMVQLGKQASSAVGGPGAVVAGCDAADSGH